MALTAVTRRTFIATSAAGIASLTVATRAEADEAETQLAPRGAVYGRVGRRGIPAGTSSTPSRGEITLLDGSTLTVSHVTTQGIRPTSGVLLAPDGNGGWSILYAEI